MTTILNDIYAVKKPAGLLSLRGRLNRTYYITYTLGSLLAAFVFMFLLGFALMFLGELGRMMYIVVSVLLFYCFLPIMFVILTIKRVHDFNLGGWLALLLLVPVINLMFWFIPGTPAENKYGAPSPVPSMTLKIVAALLPILLIGGFLVTDNNLTSDLDAPPSQPATSLQPYTP